MSFVLIHISQHLSARDWSLTVNKILLSLLFLAFSSATQPSFAQQTAAVPPAEQPSPNRVLIGNGDLLEVAVYGADDFKQQVRVSDTGEISLPLIGQVKVGGLSVAAAEKVVKQKLVDGSFYNDPQVSIFEKEYSTQGISVLGEVQKPGVYPLLGTRTLFDAISAAGGTNPKAGKTVMVTHRDHPDQPKTVTLPYDEAGIQHGDNIEILPGDTVVVSKAGIVYVVGDVRQPGGFVMDNPDLTVLKVVALAQGANPTASLDHAKLIRKTPNGMTEVPVSVKKITQSKAPDVTLQADDVLFIPNSAAKSGTKRGIEAILQAATGVAIYGAR